ncbi:kit ligand [Bombina bombina]|uniref:kit ligand n=1 Tax=Bombina bombina TaxID=8345 RepID=UPI00235A9AF3|nr:kit ligand [Bombina bombina]
MKKAKTWIITCICLQLLLICFGSPCGNPVTDAVNDIDKLVGNLPNDYFLNVKQYKQMESLPKHCWLYLMVKEVSDQLEQLKHKFSNTSQNYEILSNLSMIFLGIRQCLHLSDHMDFIDDYSHQERVLLPSEFFMEVKNTTEVFKEINNTDYDKTCVLPTINSAEDDFFSRVTKELQHTMREGNSSKLIPGKPELSSGPSLQWANIASIALSCLIVGFLVGGFVCWLVKYRKSPERTDEESTELKSDRHVLPS